MTERALITADKTTILRVAPASDSQLTTPAGEKPYWVDVVDLVEKPPLGQHERYVASLAIVQDHVERSWTVETVPPPAEVTPRQMRKALRELGLFAAIDGLIQNSGDPDLVDAWERSIGFERNHPFVAQIAASLQKTDEEIDDVFRLAATFI